MRGFKTAGFACAGAALGALLWACTIEPTPTGELGNGQFSYECPPGGVDVGCPGGTSGTPTGYVDPITGATTNLPKVIAVGSRFTVDYTPLGSSGTDIIQGNSGYAVSPASNLIAEVSAGSLIGKRAGYLALLVYGAGTESVQDFVFVRLANIASLTPDKAEVTLPGGSSENLIVTARDDASEELAGRLGCVWTVTAGADKVVLEGPTDGATAQIQAVAGGDATVTVVCSAQSTHVLVHVTGGVSVADGGGDAGDAGDAAADVVAEGGSHG